MKEQNNIWFEDANILFTKHNFFDIIPLVNMSFNEKINAISRFAIYLSILLIVFTSNLNYLYLPISIVLLFYLMYIFRPNKNKEGFFDESHKYDYRIHTHLHSMNNKHEEESEESEESEENLSTNQTIEPEMELTKCRKPNDNNPLMNLQLKDYTSTDDKRACNVTNPEISETIDKSFDDKLYLNTEVIYNTRFNQRDFYTMPNTRPYNDQGAFANWLYNTPVSCAEGRKNELKQVRACSFNNKRLDEVELM